MNLKQKLTSRKFWLSVAAFVGSLAITFEGMSDANIYITVAGIVCSTLSAGIYAICEALVDKTSLENLE